MQYTEAMTTVTPAQLAEDHVEARFAAADWSLTADRPKGGEFHPYPARYIPALPEQIMDLLDLKAGTVLDPFCGSGTTLAVARRRGLRSIGVDINPIACLISRVRTSRWVDGDEEQLRLHMAGIRSAAMDSREVGDEFADIPRLDHWFQDHAKIALSGAVRYVRQIPATDPWRDRVAAAVSAATVRVSRQDSDTRYAAINKAGNQQSAAEAFGRSLARTGAWLRTNAAYFDPTATSRVLNRDARDLSPVADNSVNLACFSPPYPNAYEYWLYHKYRMYWLGFDAVSVRESEIGARPHYSKKDGLTEGDFASQMSEVFIELKRVLVAGGHSVVIIGDSIIKGRRIDNGALIADVGHAAGFKVEYAGERNIATSKSSFNRAHGGDRKTEHVIVLRSKA